MAPKHQTKDLNSQIAVCCSQIRVEVSRGMACDLPFVSPLPLGLYSVLVRCLSGHGHPTIWTSQRRQSARSCGRTRPGEDTKFHLEELEFNHGLERRFRIGGVKACGIRLVELATVPPSARATRPMSHNPPTMAASTTAQTSVSTANPAPRTIAAITTLHMCLKCRKDHPT